MRHTHLEGKRYINLVRCSTDQQADTSPADQQKVLNQFGREHVMVHAGNDMVLEGVTGSRPGARTDIEEVIARKRELDDFDVLLVQDVGRLTRVGGDHVGKVKFDLAVAGVEVVFATGGTTGDVDQDALIQSIAAYAAQQQVKGMSYAISRGHASALAAGKIPHAFRVPYGIDRQYVGPDGRVRHRIRNLTDGTQQMLAVDSDAVLAHYPRNPKKGESVHYKRQSDERVELIPGAPDAVAVVRQVYRRALVDGWGMLRIARELNDAGSPSPDGGGWQAQSVKKIFHNPTYSGTGIASRITTGIYYSRGTDAAPQEVPRDVKSLATLKSAKRVRRPEADWKKQRLPALENYLGEELAELARDHHTSVLARDAAKALEPTVKRKPGGDKHVDSAYCLKGLLRSKQGNHAMTGKQSGPKRYRRRYYLVSRGSTVPTTGSVLSKLIAAEPLERAVLSAVRDALMDEPTLSRTILAHVEQQRKAQVLIANVDVAPLIAERNEITERLTDAMLLGAASRKLMAKQFAEWERQLASLERRIAASTSSSAPTTVDADTVVAAVMAKLKGMAESMGELPSASLRHLLGALVSRLEVDLETKDIEMELALPEAVFAAVTAKKGTAELGLVATCYQTGGNEAQRSDGLKIAFFECGHVPTKGEVRQCFACTRRAA